MEKVSVIIPVFNSEKFLKESIESILAQTYPNLEIVAVNDGSTDGSLTILENYSDKIIIISQDNKGLASALTTGINQMSGKWLKWFSPDDIMKPETISMLVNATKKNDSNCIIYSNWEMIDENGSFLRNFSESNYNDLSTFDFNVRLLDGQQINVNTTLIPYSLLEKCPINKNLQDPAAIDYDFFLRAGILQDTKFHLIAQSLVKYRIHKNQLSHKKISKTLNYLESLKEEILLKLPKNTQNQYWSSLNHYRSQKPISRKTLEKGYFLINKILPEWISDSILLVYLNKIRATR